MTSTQTPDPDLDGFETRLLAELRREVDSLPRRRPRRHLLLPAAAVAAVALLGVVVVPGLGPTTAYSVQEGNAGTVEVEVHQPEDATGLERALAEHGITADVTYLPGLQTCAPGRFTAVGREVGMRLSIGQDLLRVMLPPGAVREGETFVMVVSVEALTNDGLDGTASAVSAEVASGPVGPCEPVAAP
ncbi:hypothetical protein [Nocardioides zeicaulis]|uniref:LytR family transcriptional regulator n=1 Tax=Nocardioides zeicaulis TaxID=1776857 RepID=A0ABV6DXW6_9ACTN